MITYIAKRIGENNNMGVLANRENSLSDQQTLKVLDQAGLKAGIESMKTFNLNDPAQSVEAQEKLDQLLPKINEALDGAGLHKIDALSYKDSNSGDTLRATTGQSGGLASLNSVIQAFDQQDKPAAPAPVAPVIKQQPVQP